EADATSNLTSNGQPQIVVYPNPMSDKANIDFITPADELVTLEVFNVTGVKVAELFRGQVKGGVKQSVLFNNDNYAEGMYIYRLTTSEGSFTGNIVIVR
ncbi:MAG: T9SS type A sorting domain-containing protein, partial [Bacteroidota bacterium]